MTVRQLGATPFLHKDASVKDSSLGKWTEVGERTKIVESTMGDYSYIMNDSDMIYADVGRFCSFAAHTRVNPGNHPLERPALHHFTYRAALFDLGEDDLGFFDWRREHRVTIGHDVWLGHGAIVLPGVTIGTGAAIGAGAVVTKDVEPFAVVVGTPAKTIRKRFDDKTIDALLDIAWWNWSHEDLRQRLGDFRTLSIESFIHKYK